MLDSVVKCQCCHILFRQRKEVIVLIQFVVSIITDIMGEIAGGLVLYYLVKWLDEGADDN